MKKTIGVILAATFPLWMIPIAGLVRQLSNFIDDDVWRGVAVFYLSAIVATGIVAVFFWLFKISKQQ